MNTIEDKVVTLTDNAVKHIQKMLQQTKDALGFRLAIKKTGCSGFAYVTDIISKNNPDDIHYQHQGINLYVDSNSQKLLQGTVIDFVDHGLGQTKLIFHNPNAANLCGCGESFTVENEN